MNKHFVSAFVAVSTILAAASQGASAASPSPPVGPAEPSPWLSETGTASYYGPNYHGHRTASGVRFNQMALTAAHAWLPFGTRVRVMLADTGRSVIVTITDRLYSTRRVVDLSVAAARELGMISRGLAQVTLHPV